MQAEPRAPTDPGEPRVEPAAALDVVTLAAALLFVNGQTTRRMIDAVTRLASALGFTAAVFPRWGELTLRLESRNAQSSTTIAADPAGVDMHKVAAAMSVIDDVCAGRMGLEAARSALKAIGDMPPVSVARFASMAAAGAMALGVIFGAMHVPTLVLIGLSAGAGACLRRWLAGRSLNPFVQPFCAALLAGVIGAVAVRLQLSTMQRLVAVCPCMVLVPGPHVLNGAIDLLRAQIALGASRIAYASLIILAICAGLLAGLACGGATLPVSGASLPVPLWSDVIAAGVAVAAYGTFFAMPWRTLPFPILIGMLAHAGRWFLISVMGASLEAGAFAACLLVGIVVTPLADRLRLPFAAFAFASVVSLIPGVFLFRMAGGLVDLIAVGDKATLDLLAGIAADGITAFMIVLAITFGLILPKMAMEHVRPSPTGPADPRPPCPRRTGGSRMS